MLLLVTCSGFKQGTVIPSFLHMSTVGHLNPIRQSKGFPVKLHTVPMVEFPCRLWPMAWHVDFALHKCRNQHRLSLQRYIGHCHSSTHPLPRALRPVAEAIGVLALPVKQIQLHGCASVRDAQRSKCASPHINCIFKREVGIQLLLNIACRQIHSTSSSGASAVTATSGSTTPEALAKRHGCIIK